INRTSLQSEQVPDMYIVGNDSLEKAYLAGLASEIMPPQGSDELENLFPESSIYAITYHGRQVAYPFYFETSSFLYNKTYLEEWAYSQIEAELDAAEGEAAQAAAEEAENGENADTASAVSGDDFDLEEAVRVRAEETLPRTIDDILNFADSYIAPEQVEAIFKWDVSDIFYNYFFVGNYIDVGSMTGDDEESIDIYNENAINCMKVYQNLNQFFYIETDESNYSDVIQDFIDGKIVYTVVTTDALAKIEEAKANGEFLYEYGTSVIPNVNSELASRSLSVTQCVVVNGYSIHKDIANDFAMFLSCYNEDDLYARTGKVPALSGVSFENQNIDSFVLEYEKSVPEPKMIETSNYWVEMEIAFERIWNGEDANMELKRLSEKIMTQIKGEQYTEDYIEMPDEEEPEIIEDEYIEEPPEMNIVG
ncbi:MAG: extracellular solute-binding protein, partial [Butyrivibrio sp.]|nr:extracellular solute-binding protein [Butyrivibrio sp.]